MTRLELLVMEVFIGHVDVSPIDGRGRLRS
jgi:hypothetical protein